MFLIFNLGSAFAVAAVFALYTRLVQVNHSVLAEHVTETNEVFALRVLCLGLILYHDDKPAWQ